MPYILKLIAFPLDFSSLKNLLDRKSECKKIGQEIFDAFKKENDGKSEAAGEEVVRFCEAMLTCAKDGHDRQKYIEQAWDGIGDGDWRWIV